MAETEDALEGKSLEEQVEYLKAELEKRDKSHAKEISTRDKARAKAEKDLADILDAPPPRPTFEDTKIAEALADLKARDAIVNLKEAALERAEKEGIPYSLALKMVAQDEETTNRNLDSLVEFADKTFDKATAAAWDEPGRVLGNSPIRVKSQISRDLQGKKGRGLDIHKLSDAELSRIPRTLRSRLLDQNVKDMMKDE